MKAYLAIFGLLFSFIAQEAAARGDVWEKLQATYEAPAAPELAPYAFFPGMEIKRSAREGRVELEYHLPRELTGREVEIRAYALDQEGKRFSGPNCEMTCEGNRCVVQYPDLKLSEEEVRAYLTSRGIAGEELAARLKVFAYFNGSSEIPQVFTAFLRSGGGNPAGVIHFNIP